MKHTKNPIFQKTFWVITALFLLFVVPLTLAAWMATKDKLFSKHTTNHGTLIQPPIALSELKLRADHQRQLKHHWVLLYMLQGPCDKDCNKVLYSFRQIRTATGKNRNRVIRAVLTFHKQTKRDKVLDKLLRTDYAGTLHVVSLWPDKNILRSHVPHFPKSGDVYMVDPIANVMMYYGAAWRSEDIFKDLSRLLKISQIG